MSHTPIPLHSTASSSSSHPPLDAPLTFSLLFPYIIRILKFATPVVTAYLFQTSIGVINISFIGHLAPELLAGAAMGNMFVNITGYAFAYGLATSVDTLCSQAFGAQAYQMVGLIAVRCAVVIIICTSPIYFIWYNCEHILKFLGQTDSVAHLAGIYVWRLAPGYLPVILFDISKKYLQSQQIVKPMIWVGFVTNLFHAAVCYLYIHRWDMGFAGASAANVTAQWFMFLFGLFVIRICGYHRNTWPTHFEFSQLFKGWSGILKLGLPGMLMVCLEWWCFEIMSLLSGLLGTIELDAFITILNVLIVSYMFPLGISSAVAAMTGNHLGAGEPSEARLSSSAAIGLAWSFVTVLASSVFLFRNYIPYVFSNDTAVIEMASGLLKVTAFLMVSIQSVSNNAQFVCFYIFSAYNFSCCCFYCYMISSLFQFFDCTNGVCSGILRGVGKQSLGASTNLIAYYGIGMPTAVLLTFKLNFGVYGLCKP